MRVIVDGATWDGLADGLLAFDVDNVAGSTNVDNGTLSGRDTFIKIDFIYT